MSMFKNSYLYRILKSFFDRGATKTLRLVWEERIYPITRGLDIGGIVFPEDFSVVSNNKSHAHRYEAVNISSFDKGLSFLHINLEDYIFIDLGCGKGFALFLASLRGFKNVIGVEFEKDIAESCRKNLNKKLRPDTFEILNIDATKYTPPQQNKVFFLNNPFGEKIIKNIFKNLQDKHITEDDFIFYNNAIYKDSLLKLGYEMIKFEKTDPLNVYSGGIAIFRCGKKEK